MLVQHCDPSYAEQGSCRRRRPPRRVQATCLRAAGCDHTFLISGLKQTYFVLVLKSWASALQRGHNKHESSVFMLGHSRVSKRQLASK